MTRKPPSVPLIVCGIISIILQTAGLFSPGWMIFSAKLDFDEFTDQFEKNISQAVNVEMEDFDVDESFDRNLVRHSGVDFQMGLWVFSGCRYMGSNRTCETITIAELAREFFNSSDEPGVLKMKNDWLTLQLLASFAEVFAFVGLVSLMIFARAADDSKVLWRGGIALVSWLNSGILILAAVGKNTNDQSFYSAVFDEIASNYNGIVMMFELPWASVLSGLGGSFAVLITVMMVLYLICRERRESPGVWMKFGSDEPI